MWIKDINEIENTFVAEIELRGEIKDCLNSIEEERKTKKAVLEKEIDTADHLYFRGGN